MNRTDQDDTGVRLFRVDEEGYERVVFAEVIIPNSLNVYGDLHSEASVKEFAYGFMLSGFGRDVEHDEIDRGDGLTVVESFIARAGDQDFVPGSWVIGMHIADDDLWAQVLRGELNGFSYSAFADVMEVAVAAPDQPTDVGFTEPDIEDGHIHQYFVVLTDEGRVLIGGTTETNGHTHNIRSHTRTEYGNGHNHIFNLVKVGEH